MNSVVLGEESTSLEVREMGWDGDGGVVDS